jgi:hypothetical protein
MYLKIMSKEDAPDSDNRKTFRLVECLEATFERDGEYTMVRVVLENGRYETLGLDGNAYLMNGEGKTVASFGVSPLPKPGNV